MRTDDAIAVSDRAQRIQHTRCWCLGELVASVHPGYGSCAICGTQVSLRKKSADELKAYYTVDGYWHDAMKTVYNLPTIEERAESDFRDRIPQWFAILTKYSPLCRRVLEIGCAHGGFLHYCREHGVPEVVGNEVDERTCDWARKRFGLEHVVPGLFPDVRLPFDTFDAVTSFDVLEHVLDPLRVVVGVQALLANDGICVLQTPCYRGEDAAWGMFIPEEHYFLYTERAIQKLLQIAGLELVSILPGIFAQDMFIIGRKRRMHVPTRDAVTDSRGCEPARPWGALAASDARRDATSVAQDHTGPPANIDSTGAGRKLRCWCGGKLMPSKHPLYGTCRKCGTLVLTRQFSDDELRGYYTKDGYWHETMVKEYQFPPIEERAQNDFRDRIPVWYEVLAKARPAPRRVLEIGCAHGGFLHYCSSRGVAEVVGIEVDEATCAFARARFGLRHVCAGLFPDVELPFETFDAITGFDVLEHLRDPIPALFAVAELLSEDGVFVFQTPCYRGEDAGWAQFRAKEHLFLYNEKSIRMIFAAAGLDVRGILPGYFPDDMFVIGGKKSSRGS